MSGQAPLTRLHLLGSSSPRVRAFDTYSRTKPKHIELHSEDMFIVSVRDSRNMRGLTIRTATDNDAENIDRIIYQWIGTDKRRERVESIREAVKRDGHEIIVAELETRIIGVLHVMVYPDVMLGGQNSHIIFLLVEKDHSRKGVGSELLEKAVETAREKGAAEIHVDTIYSEAEQFYRERGFKDDGVMLERAL